MTRHELNNPSPIVAGCRGSCPTLLPAGSPGLFFTNLRKFKGGLGVAEMRGDDSAKGGDIALDLSGFIHGETVFQPDGGYYQ